MLLQAECEIQSPVAVSELASWLPYPLRTGHPGEEEARGQHKDMFCICQRLPQQVWAE